MKQFETRLRELRLDWGLTQLELAKKLNTHQKNITDWERGIKTPRMNTLCQIADVFNVSTDYLLGRENMDYTKNYPKPSPVTELFIKLDNDEQREVIGYINGLLNRKNR